MIVLVNPNNRIQGEFSGIEPPIWAGMIATIERKDKDVTIIDAEAENLTSLETVNRIREIKPERVIIVVMGANPSASSTPKMPVAYELAALIQSSMYPIRTGVLFTGLHPQAVNEQKLKTYPLWETLPPVAWDLLPMDKYRAHNWHCLDGSPRQPYGVIYTSLGCSFSCSYCNIHALYNGEHKIWYRKPEDVIAEIDLLVNKYGVRNIKIWDEMFAFNKIHVNRICDLIIDRKYDLNMWAYARVDTIDEKMLDKMKKAGINWLGYGIESASELVQEGIGKKFERAKITKTIEMTHEAGIYVHGNFIFGLPNDDMTTMRETLDFAKELNTEYVNFYVAMPYPGSPLYTNALKENRRLPKTWEGYGQYSKKAQPLPTKYLRSEDIVEFRDKAFNEYFVRPNYMQMIKEKFGKQGVGHITSMLQQKVRS